MTPTDQDDSGGYIFVAAIHSVRSGLHGYALRILPYHADLSCPHLPGFVIWSS